MSDNVRTEYRVGPAAWSGSGLEMKGEALVVPRPAEDATTMWVELTGFVAQRFPLMGSEDVRGAWRFEFALRG
jgi:hypothetical protein